METVTYFISRRINKTIRLFCCILVYGWTSNVEAQPNITSMTPISGGVGTQVTLNGINFNATPTNNIVYFGATKAAVVSATANQLLVTVPSGATYMPVSVTNSVTGLTGYSLHPFIPTFGCGEAISISSYATPLTVTTQDKPYNLNSGDLDGDGKVDMAVVNYISNTVSLYRNISSGGVISFDNPIAIATENGPVCVAIGDLNGDGKPDLAIVNYNANSVSVYKNTSSSGSISFDSKIDYSTGVTPVNVIIVDLDADGKPELAVTNGSSSSNTISIYKNSSSNGSVSFDPKTDFATGNTPIGIASGDINNDGKPDIVISNYFSNTISVFNNTSSTGNISFAARVDFPSGPYPLDVAVGDINADSKPDVVVTNYVDNYISVYPNSSSTGTISFSPYLTYPTGSGPWGVYISDLNGDAKPDLAAVSLWSGGVSVYQNNSVGSTVTLATGISFGTGSTSREISIADYNADGKPDMAIANYDDNTVGIYKNTNGGNTPSAAGSISGASTVCQGQNSVTYSVPIIANATSYTWNYTGTGVTINGTTNSVTINFASSATSGNLTVMGVNTCGNGPVSAEFPILVNTFPEAAGTITGSSGVCQGQSGVYYSTSVIPTATGYVWTVPSGATIVSGNNTNSISVDFANSAISGYITVLGINSCGNGTNSSLSITVNPKPTTPIINNIGNNILQSSSLAGNQWYNQQGAIQGATNQNYAVTVNGSYYVIATISGCSSESSNTIQIINTDLASYVENNIVLYPNPVHGILTIEARENNKIIKFEVFNMLGRTVISNSFISKTSIETDFLSPGIYTVKLTSDKMVKLTKIIKK